MNEFKRGFLRVFSLNRPIALDAFFRGPSHDRASSLGGGVMGSRKMKNVIAWLLFCYS